MFSRVQRCLVPYQTKESSQMSTNLHWEVRTIKKQSQSSLRHVILSESWVHSVTEFMNIFEIRSWIIDIITYCLAYIRICHSNRKYNWIWSIVRVKYSLLNIHCSIFNLQHSISMLNVRQPWALCMNEYCSWIQALLQHKKHCKIRHKMVQKEHKYE